MDVTPLGFDGGLSGGTDGYEISRGQYRKVAAVDAADSMSGPQALCGIDSHTGKQLDSRLML